MKARVIVTLKDGILDPQGKAIEKALHALDVQGIHAVRQGKIFDIECMEQKPEALKDLLVQACRKLLANEVIEDYHIETGSETAKGETL